MKIKAILFSILILTLSACTTLPETNLATETPSWAGKWKGTLTNHPTPPGAKTIEVIMEIGEFPKSDNSSSTWRTTYLEQGQVRQVKDYRLCRGAGAGDLYIDEGNGIILKSRLIGGVLVTPFKYNDILLITSVRLHGDVLEQEILTVEDKPAIEGVQSMNARSIQRLELRRQASPDD